MEQAVLLQDGEAAEVLAARRAAKQAEEVAEQSQAAPRLVVANRSQIELRPQDLESLLPPCHRARAIWAVVEHLDLSRFYEPIKARGSRAGRAATDPKVLVALWLYATGEGVGNAHELERLCTQHDAYRWLRGGVPVNYHTLSDFRTDHETALDELFTQVLAVMLQQGLVTLKRVAQDGMRVRASAGAGSFRRRARLEEFLAAAKEQVEAVKQQRDEPPAAPRGARQQAAQERRRARACGARATGAGRVGEDRATARRTTRGAQAQRRAACLHHRSRSPQNEDGGRRLSPSIQYADGYGHAEPRHRRGRAHRRRNRPCPGRADGGPDRGPHRDQAAGDRG